MTDDTIDTATAHAISTMNRIYNSHPHDMTMGELLRQAITETVPRIRDLVIDELVREASQYDTAETFTRRPFRLDGAHRVDRPVEITSHRTIRLYVDGNEAAMALADWLRDQKGNNDDPEHHK